MFFKPDTMELDYESIPDSFQIDLDDDFQLMNNSMDQMDDHLMDDRFHGLPSSIEGDLAKVSSDGFDIFGASCLFSRDEEDTKIRNVDCMWSAIHNGINAGTNMNNGGNSAASSFSDTISMPLAAVSNPQNPYDLQQQQTTTTITTKLEPLDDTNTTTTAYQSASSRLRLGDKKSIVQLTTNVKEELIPPAVVCSARGTIQLAASPCRN